MRILVAEDEASLRLTLAANLELAGYEVLEACDGQEAIATLEREQIDVVLSDVRMPNLNGIDLLKHIKQAFPTLPVLLMTAYTGENQLDAAVFAGAFTVLKKPFDVDNVLEILVRAARCPAVLVVADSHAAQDLATNLRAAGLRAELAANSEQVLELVRTERIDVCLADLKALGGDASAMLTALGEQRPAVAVIVLGGADAADATRSQTVHGYLRMPVSRRDILQSVSRVRGGAG